MSMATAPPSDILSKLTNDLKSKNEEVRLQSAQALKDHVVVMSRELSGQDLKRFYGEVNSIIWTLVQSVDNNDKLCGVMIIDKLIGIEGEENTTQETRFANYLRQLFPADVKTMTVAARALGKLAQQGGTFTTEFVEFELKRAIEWLTGDRQEARRHASVLVLAELVRHADVIVYPFVASILEHIWVAFRDPNQNIRVAAADALSAVLVIIADRDSPYKSTWYNRISEEAQRGLRIASTESIHGSLLIYRELLLHAGMFMHERYKSTGEIVFQYKDHRDGLVRRAVISLIPDLAAYNPQEFANVYLHRAMVHILSQLRKDKERSLMKEKDRSNAFLAIGKIALVAGADMGEFLDDILICIREGLRLKSKNRIQTDTPIFSCISMLANAVGQALTKHMHELLELMFATGLSEPLRQSLTDLSNCIPPLLPIIQERLLNMLSMILSGHMYKPLGAPNGARTGLTSSPVRRDIQSAEPKDVDSIILALTTLGSFNFQGHILNEFVRDCCIPFLEDDNPDIRRSAAKTCCQLFVRDPICFQTSAHAVQVVGEVLEKLLTVGIADPDPEIRRTVMESLDERFDRHLAQAENVRSLFIALNDEIFAIREHAITIIGRLSMHNPAYVMPSLRKTLIQLLTEIEYSGVSRNKEESARLLALLVISSQRLVKPYVESIIKVLLPKAKDQSAGVVSSILAALGELARVGGEDLLPFMDQLMPLIIDTLQDQSSPTKRSAALKTLGQLASNTGYVIEPYIKYPGLLDTLMNILKTEQSGNIRKETIKLLGILGALDPYRHKQMAIESVDDNQADKSQGSDVSLLMSGLGPSSEDYYPTVVINALLKILKDPSLSQQYQPATQAILNIFQALQLKMVPFLPQIMPVYLSIMQSGTVLNLDFYFEKMGFLVMIVKLHIRPYLPDLLQLVKDNWNHTPLQERIIGLVESIAVALDGEFKAYLPNLLQSFLAVFDTDLTERHDASIKVLGAFVKFGSNIEEYMHLVIPVLVKTFEKPDAPINLRRAAINTIRELAKKVNFSDYASRIIHPFARILALPGPELRMPTMDALCCLVLQLGQDYVNFIPMIKKVLIRTRISHAQYDHLVSQLLKREPLPLELPGLGDDRYVSISDVPQAESGIRKLPVNQASLRRAWDTQPRSTKDDWADWIRRLCLEMLKETPSHALRACADMANSYHPLARELFNAAFVSCWGELLDQYQEELARALVTALVAPNISPEIIQILLNLAEFMEHDDKPLPIDIRTLGEYAAKSHAFAKALHYKELEFLTEPSTNAIEELIGINNNLQQPDAAAGILTHAQLHHDFELKEAWYERLQRWEDALAAYERKQLENPNDLTLTNKRMRCLHALGEWDQLSSLAQAKWGSAPPQDRRKMASFAAAAAWGLGQWELLDEYISAMQENSDRAFFKAILALHRNQFQEAEKYIDKTRNMLDTELTALVGESYNRAYATVVRVQMMAELEEIIAYKQYHDQPDRQATIRRTWMKRLKGCQRNVEVWQKLIKVHAIVVTPAQDMEMRIKFMNLCRKNGRLRLAENTMSTLMGPDTANMSFTAMTQVTPPQIVYAKLKYMWATGVREHTLDCLRQFTERLASDLGLGTVEDAGIAMTGANQLNGNVVDYSRLLARCYLKQGEWQFALQDGWTHDSIEDILTPYLYAKHLDKDWYKAWHTWALANFEVITFYEKNPPPNHSGRDPCLQYVIPSIMGFFKSIALSQGNSLQDTLRLLTLWFKFGHRAEISAALSDGFSTVSIDTWLQVIPQLIARIHAPSPNVQRLIHQLLTDVGKEHPQALVYSLTVASKSPSVVRKNAALAIMEKMRVHSPLLVEQALLVSQELIRVAILWHEMWHEGLEEASRLYFGDRNINGMLALLEPLHMMLQRGPETQREIAFNQAFGRDLREAQECCIRYGQTQEINDLNQAWDIYYQVFRRIAKQLQQLSTLDLPYVSPQLQGAQDLELAIPGTYKSGEPIIKISSFVPTLTVMTSKQRPRRLTVKGSDGRDYQYLLKGHEDLRQDERVMQLFGLVNTLLSIDPETFKRYLGIQRYPVIPLSPNSGLIGWLPDTDTLHTLIRDYRESRKILLNIEHRIMLQMAPDYDNLTLMQKVEVFEYALNNTGGQDLYKVLWLKSRNSEAWLDRRTNYTRSLAVMSMVGYILGLGDRHPSNLMLDRNSGKIVHIDFGDCFEVAMHREKFPEQIPFRLTRMLTNAMEVSGIEGNFRNTCENVMRVLRENKESLMAVLEAFVYDPLINWRILTTSPRQPMENGQGGNQNAANESVMDEQARNMRRALPSERELVRDNMKMENQPEQLNQRAVSIINRVTNKLTGRDFKPDKPLDVPSQVEKLIQQASSYENLCQCWIGWCAFW
ncbi:phosphatidylinositol kinase Tor2 [Lobosporangium transversale]|uniref:Serine/threonine-protein kinase TOR n=1 Tax=Lobosporangium transversale TaxID=64571 RepID=A0A1Y2GGM1_9FUNG|nr:phosphatidylinositol kinase Tor2 [Lobosporangium transversale]ORZ10331.1 phosphatidylinositol kinase Tor2 [Lobosporangium transversale]|eukprot:XP_021879238.1 phosphatidylinositol kinase Tor2 [Lobosporangium transversale]